MAVGDVLVLPDPPGAINLSVMEEECRVSWGSEDVSTWIATDGEVSGGVDSVETSGEITLHGGLEVGDVGVLDDEIGGVLISAPLRRNPHRDVALEAARVVVCTSTRTDHDDAFFSECWRNWTKVDRHAVKSVRII